MDCIFCKIIKGEIPCKKAYEDKDVLAFYDIDPQAPLHIVVIPKEHIPFLDSITEENSIIIAKIFNVISMLSSQLKMEKGFRVVSNCKEQGGQTVDHLHFHLLSGRNLGWPPG